VKRTVGDDRKKSAGSWALGRNPIEDQHRAFLSSTRKRKETREREREGAVILPGLVGFPRARISALFSEERDSRGKEEEEEE
jgi:hypothetical protein